jgi:hypothetical protein
MSEVAPLGVVLKIHFSSGRPARQVAVGRGVEEPPFGRGDVVARSRGCSVFYHFVGKFGSRGAESMEE